MLEIPEYQDLFKYLINITSAQLYTCQNVSGLIWGYTDAYLQKLHELGLSPVEVHNNYALTMRCLLCIVIGRCMVTSVCVCVCGGGGGGGGGKGGRLLKISSPNDAP